MHKFYNRCDVPWVNLIWSKYYEGLVPHAADLCGSSWWRDILQLTPIYRGVTSVEVCDGSSVLFWKDQWHNIILGDSHPRLFSFTADEDVLMQALLTAPTLGRNFQLPLSTQAREELRDLQGSLSSTELSEAPDIWRCMWGARASFPRNTMIISFVRWWRTMLSNGSGTQNALINGGFLHRSF